jgi:anthrone oxygenase-like protein
MWPLIIATVCAGLFAGAAIYINAVEHPARLSCGSEIALRQFAPSYRRATVMQASLAVVGCLSGLWYAWLLRDVWVGLAAALLGAVVPFTLIVILPTNKLDPSLDQRGARAAALLGRWGRLHAVRSLLSSVAFVLLLLRLGVQ